MCHRKSIINLSDAAWCQNITIDGAHNWFGGSPRYQLVTSAADISIATFWWLDKSSSLERNNQQLGQFILSEPFKLCCSLDRSSDLKIFHTRNSTVVPILRRMGPVPSYFGKVSFNVVLIWMLTFLVISSFQAFQLKFCMHLFSLPLVLNSLPT